MRRIFVGLIVLFSACTNENNGETSSLSSLDSNTANNPLAINSDKILIQGFTQMPSIINNCSALFVKDTMGNGPKEYYFVSDLKGTAFIKLNNRLMELKLLKQTNVDKYTVNELYANEEVEVDLKIKQIKEETNTGWNYSGVLIIRRGTEREAINIAGKLGC
jgi:hypothetical protein